MISFSKPLGLLYIALASVLVISMRNRPFKSEVRQSREIFVQATAQRLKGLNSSAACWSLANADPAAAGGMHGDSINGMEQAAGQQLSAEPNMAFIVGAQKSGDLLRNQSSHPE